MSVFSVLAGAKRPCGFSLPSTSPVSRSATSQLAATVAGSFGAPTPTTVPRRASSEPPTGLSVAAVAGPAASEHGQQAAQAAPNRTVRMRSKSSPNVGCANMTRESESGFPIEPLYSDGDLAPGLPERLGKPGEYPFTRGVYPSMYTGRPWTMRQYAGFGTAKESNERYRHLVAQGTGGLSVAFDLPTQMGYDSDEPVASGEVGKVGVAIDSLEDMRLLFDQIPLDQVSTSMTINAPAAVLLLMYQLVAEENGVPGWQDHRHDPERRAQGVHRPRDLHLPAGALAAADHQHLPVLPRRDPEVEHHLDLRLPHGRGRSDADAGGRASPCPTGSSTSARPSPAVRTSTTSPRGWPSSSSRAPPCSRRSRSSAPPGGSGPT